MGYKIGVLTLHGMGDQKKDYSACWEKNTRGKLSVPVSEEVVFEEVYYQDIMQKHQTRLWEKLPDSQTKSPCPPIAPLVLGIAALPATVVAILSFSGLLELPVLAQVLGSLLLVLGLTALTIATWWAVARLLHQVWIRVRKFLLYAFSDPATYAHKYDEPGSIYQQVHKRVSASLMSLCAKLDADGRVVVMAHSFGAHVLSNHIWDAQLPLRTTDADAPDPELMRRLRESYPYIERIARVFTAGSNITLFVAGLPEVQPFCKPSDDFKWCNFYDKDDVLGWPLRPLPPGSKRSYADLVAVERRINVGGFWRSWNPLSHNEYFGPGTSFIKHVADQINQLHRKIASTKGK